jgi:Helicase conserved C-terminal domain
MPDLVHSLQGHDLGHIRIAAELWGIELRSKDAEAAAREFAAGAQDQALATEVIEALSPKSRSALAALELAGGRIPWAAFSRRFGEIREMGAAKRDRDQPHLQPVSPAEELFYRGLLGQAFFETGDTAQEFAYVPDDLLPLIHQNQPEKAGKPEAVLGRAATAAEHAHVISATDGMLDDMTTLLAARRIGEAWVPDPVLEALAGAAGLVQGGALQAAAVKSFLEASRHDASVRVVDAWRASDSFNELHLMPGLVFEGRWTNHPLAARAFLLRQLEQLPRRSWWNLQSFVQGIKQRHPDFQRPAGDYDSWFIKDAAEDRYLRGFEAWERVDGALVRFFIVDVLHRLGLVDLANGAGGSSPTAFRMLESEELEARRRRKEDRKLKLTAQGRITAAPLVPRAIRYQAARFCDWDEQDSAAYHYRISPRGLQRAARQGLKADHLIQLLAKYSDAGIPSAVAKALRRWQTAGTEARTETETVLRVTRPDILQQLRQSKAARFLGEALGPTAVIVKEGAQARVVAALTELGVLAEEGTDNRATIKPHREAAAPSASPVGRPRDKTRRSK